jgi:hypothetical protein
MVRIDDEINIISPVCTSKLSPIHRIESIYKEDFTSSF